MLLGLSVSVAVALSSPVKVRTTVQNLRCAAAAAAVSISRRGEQRSDDQLKTPRTKYPHGVQQAAAIVVI